MTTSLLRMRRRRYNKKSPPKLGRVEVALVWNDGSRCQATVPSGDPSEVTCGSSRFMRTMRIDTTYSTCVYQEIHA